MKKMFFAAAIIAAMMFTACTKEKAVNNGTDPSGGTPISGNTAVSFTFNIAPDTRALTHFAPTGIAARDNQDNRIGTQDLYILIFDLVGSGGVLEKKAQITASSTTPNPNITYTTMLKTGDKKIFVLANIGTTVTASQVQPNLKNVTLTTLAASTSLAPFSSFTEGVMTLAQFYAVAFDAGVPKPWNINKSATSPWGFNLVPFWTLQGTGTPGNLGIAMSNSNQYSFTLNADVTEAQANTSGTPVISGSETYNRFKVVLDYMSAKARLTMDMAAINAKPGKDAVISEPLYGMKNLAKYTSLVQNVMGTLRTDGRSIYQSLFDPAQPEDYYVQADFDPHFDQAMNVRDKAAPTDVTGHGLAVPASLGPFIFIPENTSANIRLGQATFYALSLYYKPKSVVESVTWSVMSPAPPTGAGLYTLDTWDNLKTAGKLGGTSANQHVYDPAGVVNNGQRAYYFASVQTYADAVWYSLYGNTGYSAAAAWALVWNDTDGEFQPAYKSSKIYADAVSWYRINVGVNPPVSTHPKFGVLRGYAYTANITDILGPGAPNEGDLFEDPGKFVETNTYINVMIEARGWTPVPQNDVIVQ